MGIYGCYYDVEEVLYPGGVCNTENVTYSGTIVPILERECYSCHNALSQNGGVNLQGHNNVVRVVEDGRLWGSVNHDSGFARMPDGRPKLDACTLERIMVWIEGGAVND